VIDGRAFIGSLAIGTLAVPRAAPAQLARNVARVGILTLGVTSNMTGPQPQSPSVDALLRGLRERGNVPRGSSRLPAWLTIPPSILARADEVLQ
jgi:hypothetical protein